MADRVGQALSLVKVLVTDTLADSGLDILRSASDVDLDRSRVDFRHPEQREGGQKKGTSN